MTTPRPKSVAGKYYRLFLWCFIILFLSYQPSFPSPPYYTFSVASFQDIESSAKEVNRLTNLGYKAFCREKTDPDGIKRYDVCIGEYPFRDTAIVEAYKIKKSHHIDSYQIFKVESPAMSSKKDIKQNKNKMHKKKGYYTIHVSSFKKMNRAERDMLRFKDGNYKPFCRLSKIPEKGAWYRVYIGNFNTKSEAVEAKKALTGQYKLNDCQILFLENTVPKDDAKSRYLLSTLSPENSNENDIVNTPSAIAPQETISKVEPSDIEMDILPGETENEVPEEISEALEEPDTRVPESPRTKNVDKNTGKAPEVIARSHEEKHDRFSISLKTGLIYTYDVEDFEIDNDRTLMNISGKTVSNASLTGSFFLKPSIAIDACYEKLFADGIDSGLFLIGTRIQKSVGTKRFPYLRLSYITGNFDWKDAPGSFKDGTGWEVASGFTFFEKVFKIGIESSYRDIKFKYKVPSAQNVTANTDNLNLSGLTVSVFVLYSL